MEIITGYTGKPHVTSEQDCKYWSCGRRVLCTEDWNAVGSRGIFQQ